MLEVLSSKTGITSAAAIDTIVTQPRFADTHDIGTGPLYGNSVSGDDTGPLVIAAVQEVRKQGSLIRVRFKLLVV